MKLLGDKMCFACGKDNPISLGLDFQLVAEDRAAAEFVPQDVHQGYDNLMHGGLVSTLLDEAMAQVIYLNNIKAVTAEMRIRFKKPVRIGKKIEITGILSESRGKLIKTEAYLRDEDENLLAKAEAKFMVSK